MNKQLVTLKSVISAFVISQLGLIKDEIANEHDSFKFSIGLW